MEEGKKILGIFLVVLFIIVVLGVVISRTNSKNKKVPILGGSLESVLFPDRPTPKPSIVVAKKTNTTTTTSTTTKTESAQTTEAAKKAAATKTAEQNSQVPVVLGDSTTTTNGGTKTTTSTTSTTGSAGSTTTSGTTSTTSQSSKGGVNEAESIPAAGTPTIYLSLALSALASGVALKKLV